MNYCKPLLLVCIGWLVAGTASAQNYSIDWYKIAGGGGTSSGGNYTLSGIIGQPDAGVMSGGNYSLVGGFWAIVSAIQTPGAPLLKITLTATNSVLVSWPSPSTGFQLQFNGGSNVGINSGNWQDYTLTINDDGVTRSTVITPPVGTWFFRLKK